MQTKFPAFRRPSAECPLYITAAYAVIYSAGRRLKYLCHKTQIKARRIKKSGLFKQFFNSRCRRIFLCAGFCHSDPYEAPPINTGSFLIMAYAGRRAIPAAAAARTLSLFTILYKPGYYSRCGRSHSSPYKNSSPILFKKIHHARSSHFAFLKPDVFSLYGLNSIYSIIPRRISAAADPGIFPFPINSMPS